MEEKKTLQQRIEEYHAKQLLLMGPDKLIKLELGEDGKAYVVKVHSGDMIIPEWVSGFWCKGKAFNSLEEICDYYGINEDELRTAGRGEKTLSESIEFLANVYYRNKNVVMSMKEICERLKLDYDKVMKYRKENPNLSRNEILIQFKFDIAINLFGWLIIPEER